MFPKKFNKIVDELSHSKIDGTNVYERISEVTHKRVKEYLDGVFLIPFKACSNELLKIYLVGTLIFQDILRRKREQITKELKRRCLL